MTHEVGVGMGVRDMSQSGKRVVHERAAKEWVGEARRVRGGKVEDCGGGVGEHMSGSGAEV